MTREKNSSVTKPRSKRGGARPGAGRKPGSLNRVGKALKLTLAEMCRNHTELAVKALVEEAMTATGSARVNAAIALLDRGYGRPYQAVHMSGDVTLNLFDVLASIARGAADSVDGDAAGRAPH